MSTHANVYEAVSAAMVDIGGVSKSRDNKMQGFKYRGIADVSLAVQPALAKHGLCIAPYEIHTEEWREATTKSGGAMMHARMRIEFRCYHASGTWLPIMVTGEAMDTGDKTANKVMAVSLKYCLTQLFCIPEEDPEIDTDAHSPGEDLAPKTTTSKAPPKAEPPTFPKVTMAEAKRVSDALAALLPDSLPLARAEYVAWAIGRKPQSAGDLNTAEATLLLAKIKNGEMPEGSRGIG